MSEYKNGGDNNMLWEQGAQVRILVPRHRKPRSYRNVTPFLFFLRISSIFTDFWAWPEKSATYISRKLVFLFPSKQ